MPPTRKARKQNVSRGAKKAPVKLNAPAPQPTRPTSKAAAKKSAAKPAAKSAAQKSTAKRARAAKPAAPPTGQRAPARPNPAAPAPAPAPAAPPDVGGRRLVEIPVTLIDPSPYQPRKTFGAEEMKELEASLEQPTGLLQPISVRRKAGRYELIAGERRLRAARNLGWTAIPAVVRELSDAEAATLAGVENLQRADLTPWEEADLYAARMREFGWSQAELARRFGIPRSVVGDRERLRTSPGPWQAELRRGTVLQISHAAALSPYRPAPPAVHVRAFDRARQDAAWTANVALGQPVPVEAFASLLRRAYGPDLYSLHPAPAFDPAAYTGPVVELRYPHGGAEPFAADPDQWRPLLEVARAEREQARAQAQTGARDPRDAAAVGPSAAPGAAPSPAAPRLGTLGPPVHGSSVDAPPRAGAGEPRPLRPDVEFALPDGHRTASRDGASGLSTYAFLTDQDGNWTLFPLAHAGEGRLRIDPSALAPDLAPAALVLVDDHVAGARRVATTDLAAVRAAAAAWEARWRARGDELAAAADADGAFEVRGPGARYMVARECKLSEELAAPAVRAVAERRGLELPAGVLDEVGYGVGSGAGGYAGEETEGWLREQPLDVVEEVAAALLRLDALDDRAGTIGPLRAQVQREQAAAVDEIAARPVPWRVPSGAASEVPAEVAAIDAAIAGADEEALRRGELPDAVLDALDRADAPEAARV